MPKYNRAEMRDKIYACWMGKNIGGTLGTPYEGQQKINDIKGFATEPGEALVNDDLDLQLVWLRAVEQHGYRAINERLLGEYWLTYITPHWNEYGVCKSNLHAGFMPPLSGEVTNDQWKHSNGAWIRTEIWACLFPGSPDTAIRYAYYDACVDHGYGEGTYAAIFVEAMESAAFVTNDLRKLLDIGLSKIPADCRTAQSVRLAIEEYDRGTSWQDTRNKIVEQNKDLGWFQAPGNVAFTVLALLYGEGDFKKTLLTAVNCGDDTDCTAATAGALLGIMNGTAGIPDDWKAYLGDKITIGCLLHGHCEYPKTCTDLTNRIMDMQSETLRRVVYVELATVMSIVDGETDLSDVNIDSFMGSAFAETLGSRSRYSFEESNIMVTALVELDNAPEISSFGTISGTVTLTNTSPMGTPSPYLHGQRRYNLRWLTQDGFTVSGDLSVHCHQATKLYGYYKEPSIAHFTIQAPEQIRAMQNIVLEITSPGRFMPLYVSIPLMGK
ncbi:MAG: ADP-ribosylglycohydrolase family protein [Clostridia bacterium]|nr:ADP-ribosylglycohydrolase family protein [Clostridia bacterium]